MGRHVKRTGSFVSRRYARHMYEGFSRRCVRSDRQSKRLSRFVLGDIKPTQWNVATTSADTSEWHAFKSRRYKWYDLRRYNPSKGSMAEVVVLSTSAEDLLAQRRKNGSELAIAYTVGKIGEAAVVAGLLQDTSEHGDDILGALRAGAIGRAAMLGLLRDDGTFEPTAAETIVVDSSLTTRESAERLGTVVQ